MTVKYSVILAFLGQLRDRFAVYHEPASVEEKIAAAAKVEGIKGIEPVYPFDFVEFRPDNYKDLLGQYDLEVSSVNINIKTDPIFHHGAITSPDPGVRAEAVAYMKAGMDWAAELGTNLVTMCPLADGHDYPFEINYTQAWTWMVDCLGETAAYRPEVKLAIEYKQSEPRARVIVPNAGVVLYLCEQIGLDNVGLTIDTGHAFYISETPAQVIALAAQAERLFLIHINDNYRNWDWDMIPGSVNFWDWLEMLMVLDEVEYDGWLVSDVFPSRMDPIQTLSASYRAIQTGNAFLDKFGRERLAKLIERRNPIAVFDEFHGMILG